MTSPTQSEDEQKVIDYSKNALSKRADFFNEAAKRHPEMAKQFNALADATRDMASIVYVPEGKEDKALVNRIAQNYAPNLRDIMIAAQKKPVLADELKESQRILQKELDAFETRHPELVAVRDRMNAAPKPN